MYTYVVIVHIYRKDKFENESQVLPLANKFFN